ncbi:MAG: ABC-F family ATP-binding cassette domain-containing protein [Synergistaceae bacterium]|nr:ABC-F family ATP-binding cassette domain-containing protein [Synergistaceae bacterium]
MRDGATEVGGVIEIRGLRLAFGEKVLFDDVGLRIADDARLCIVGPNGAGKTTLLRVLMGMIEPDAGTVERSKGLTVGWLPQELAELDAVSVMELLKMRSGVAEAERRLREIEDRLARAEPGSPGVDALLADHARAEQRLDRLGGASFEPMALKVLRGLGFSRGDEDRGCRTFSGGWKMRIAMAALLVSAPDVLFLDEPTNHLDVESMEWLEGWLRAHDGAVVAVSHDRRFLADVARQIADLDRGRLTLWPYGYERYLVERQLGRERLEREAEAQRREAARIEAFVDRFRYKASKASQVQSRLKMLARMERDRIELDGPTKSAGFRIPEAPSSGRRALRAEGLSKRYGDLLVFEGVGLTLERGERVGLIGVNGAGKSTLVRLLSGREAPTSGTVELGHGVRLASFSQESARELDASRTVWEEARAAPSKLDEPARRTLLGAFLFSGEDVHKSVSVLSGGEKARLALYRLMLAETNFLILDEPTNHLDPTTRDVVERALLQYQGTLLIVSHDRHLLDALVERVLEIRGGRLWDWPGNYSWALEKREEAVAREQPAAADGGQRRPAKGAKDEKEERARALEEARAIKRELAPVERGIEGMEARRAEIDAALCDPATLGEPGRASELMVERAAVERALGEAYARWEELSLRLEAIPATGRKGGRACTSGP